MEKTVNMVPKLLVNENCIWQQWKEVEGDLLIWHDLKEKETWAWNRNNSGNGKQPWGVWKLPRERMGSLCSQGRLENCPGGSQISYKGNISTSLRENVEDVKEFFYNRGKGFSELSGKNWESYHQLKKVKKWKHSCVRTWVKMRKWAARDCFLFKGWRSEEWLDLLRGWIQHL